MFFFFCSRPTTGWATMTPWGEWQNALSMGVWRLFFAVKSGLLLGLGQGLGRGSLLVMGISVYLSGDCMPLRWYSWRERNIFS